jgi:hypothetical protein
MRVLATVDSISEFGKGTTWKGATSSRFGKVQMNGAASIAGVHAHLDILTRSVVLLFSLCMLSWTYGGAQAVGGPIHRGDCVLPHMKLQESWGKLFDRIPANSEKSILLENLSLKGLGFYSSQTNYQLPTFRVTPNGPQVPLFPAHDEDKPSFDWRCRRYLFGSI